MGKSWPGLEAYYRKNCDGKGDRQGIFVSFPEKSVGDFEEEQTNRKEHKSMSTKERNKLVGDCWKKNGDLQPLVDEGIINRKEVGRYIEGCRLLDQHQPLSKYDLESIYHTEIFWVDGPSRSGKTESAKAYYGTLIPGDPTSRELSKCKLVATAITKGFMNGYEGEELCIIEEIPQYWGMRHDTMSALKVMLDN